MGFRIVKPPQTPLACRKSKACPMDSATPGKTCSLKKKCSSLGILEQPLAIAIRIAFADVGYHWIQHALMENNINSWI